SQPITVKYIMSGNANQNIDYDLVGTFTFNAGQATTTVTLAPNANNLGTSTQDAILTLDPGEGYEVTGTGSTATVTIYDLFPLVTVAATIPNAVEPGTNGQFTVTRYGSIVNPITVGYVMQGTAVPGKDYAPIGTITIPGGATSVTVPLTVIDDKIHEQTETATLFLTPSPTAAYFRSAVHSATVTITDVDPLPAISITASKPNATLGVTDGEFTITIVGGQEYGYPINFTMTGTAIAGTDYAPITSITVAPGITQVKVPVTVLANNDPGATVTLNLNPSLDYTLANPRRATVTLLSQATPYVTVQATDPVATASGSKSGTFTISRTGATALDQVVNFTLSGTAVNGTDYVQISQILIPAGQSSVAVPVTAIPGGSGAAKTVVLTINPSAGYLQFPGLQAATVYISSGLTVTATVSETWEISSPPGVFTITRGSGNLNLPLVVNFTIGGTAVAGTDYQAIPGQVTIPAGEVSAKVRIFGIRHDTADGTRTVTLTLLPSGGLTPDAPLDHASVDILGATQVSVSAYAANASESGTPGVFNFQRIGDTTGPLVVPYVLTGTATEGLDYKTLGQIVIPAGAVSVDVLLQPFRDTYTGINETATLTILRTESVVAYPSGSATITIVENVPQISVAATTPTTPEGGDPGVFTFTRVGNLSQAVEIPYLLTGSAVEGSDYQPLGHIIIPAGQASVTADVTAYADDIVEGDETVTIEILNSPDLLVGTPNTATITIIDMTPPIVSVVATIPQANEETSTPGLLTFTRIGNDTNDLQLSYTLGGSAIEGQDYQTVGTIIFPAHTSTLTVPIMPIDDNIPEATETVTFSLETGADYTVSDLNLATVHILDSDLPTVSIVGTDTVGMEGQTPPNNAMVTIWRNGDLSQPMTVTIGLSGTAVPGRLVSLVPPVINPANASYYFTGVALAANQITVTIPLEQSFVQIPVNIFDNTIPDGTRTAIFTVVPTAGSYLTTPGTDTTTVTILDNEVPRLSVTASVPLATEENQSPGILTIARQGTLEIPLTVAYTVGGTAINGVDYVNPGTIVIPAGAASIDVPITPIDDNLSEGPETVIFALQASPTNAYSLDPLNAKTQATITIADNDPATVTVAATQPNASEAGVQGQFTFTRAGNITNDLPITYQLAGTAITGTDYQALGNIVIPAGQASVAVPLIPIDDNLVEPTETVALTILPSASFYVVGAPSSATVNILDSHDNIPPTVSTFTKPKIVAGANSPTFTVTYSDNGQVDRTSLGNGNLLITGPKAYRQYAVFVSANAGVNAQAITATYRIITPGPTWDSTDNGTYTVSVQPNQIKDVSGNPMSPQAIGTFTVALAAPKKTAKKVAAKKTAASPLAASKPFVFNTHTPIAVVFS
ncbi:MAG: beta strand repeat-containing protein, partial [Tepidisphaerales bacterium]